MPVGSWTYDSKVPESVEPAVDPQHCTMTRERFAETLMPAVTDGTSHGLRLYGRRD